MVAGHRPCRRLSDGRQCLCGGVALPHRRGDVVNAITITTLLAAATVAVWLHVLGWAFG
jgi:hypothetical protein